MSNTQPPIIAAIEAVSAAYRNAREVGAQQPTEPALMIAAQTRIADALDARIALTEAAATSAVEVSPDVFLPLALADPMKHWALIRARSADLLDAKTARSLADWWGKLPDPSRRARARRG